MAEPMEFRSSVTCRAQHVVWPAKRQQSARTAKRARADHLPATARSIGAYSPAFNYQIQNFTNVKCFREKLLSQKSIGHKKFASSLTEKD